MNCGVLGRLCALLIAFYGPFTLADSALPLKVPVGSVFVYKKSNLDGTNEAYIAVYYASVNELESFKWHSGNDHATIVRATINVETTNVSRFEAYSFNAQQGASLRAVLQEAEAGHYQIRLGDREEVFVTHTPVWHSYDFDFASLGYAYRFIENIETGYTFNVLDFDMAANPPQFRDFGKVHIGKGREESRWSRQVIRYDIDGDGLDNRGGQIWFDRDGKFLVAYQIEKPDERGYESGQLVLERIIALDSDAWAEFKQSAIAPR